MSLTDEAVLSEILNQLGESSSKPIRYEDIAQALGCSKLTVIRATSRLAVAGRIQHRGGRGKPTEFTRNE